MTKSNVSEFKIILNKKHEQFRPETVQCSGLRSPTMNGKRERERRAEGSCFVSEKLFSHIESNPLRVILSVNPQFSGLL